MKKLLIATTLLSMTFSCAKNNKTNNDQESLSDTERIAKAYGIDNFALAKRLEYTFNVQRDTIISSRSWIWNIETGEITSYNKEDTVVYAQSNITEELKRVDHRFINDKYWLLFPFHLVWDDNLTITNMGMQSAPISGTEMIKLTALYGNEGGYTPGDAYDLYLDENWIIREWEFRKGNQEDPGLATTWEGYTDYNGIKIATDHRREDGSFRLYFTDIKVQ